MPDDVRWSQDSFPAHPLRKLGKWTDPEDGSKHVIVRYGNCERQIIRADEWKRYVAVDFHPAYGPEK